MINFMAVVNTTDLLNQVNKMSMKYLLILLLLIPMISVAQIDFPPASPDATWNHQLGFTQVSLSYSRPQMRGRKIFGSLVPYNDLWRTGAGESTRITFSEDIIFGDQIVKKGKYGVYSIPNQNEWTIILNEDSSLHGDFGYEEKKDVLRIKVKPSTFKEVQESFTMDLVDFKADYSASLELRWENTSVKIPIKSMADGKVMAQIEEVLLVNQSTNPGLLNKGAQYYVNQNKDLNQAAIWSQQSEKFAPDEFNYALLTSKIFSRLKNYPEAIAAAERALELADDDKMAEIKAQIEDWKKYIIPQGMKIGQFLPNVTVQGIKKDVVNLQDLKGKVHLIDFWASWCAPCRKANKKLVKLYKEYGGKDFEIVGISVDTDMKKWQSAILKDKLEHSQYIDPKGFDAKSAEAFEVEALPASYLFDKEGRLVMINPSENEITNYLNQIKKN